MLTKSLLLSVLNLLPLASCHFLLNFPPTIGFDDDKEGTYPCGSFDITSRENVTDYPIGGSPIALVSTHPQATWEFRAALLNDTDNWTNILPVILQNGQGDFCPTGITIPSAWEGQDGVIQVVQDAADGFLYQCAAVHFTSGSTTSNPASCLNKTSPALQVSILNEDIEISASATSIVSLSAGATSTPTGSAASSTTSSAPATTTSSKPSSGYRNEAITGIVMGIAGVVAGLLL